MNDVLLVFPYNLKQSRKFEEIVSKFEESGYDVHSFDGISRENIYIEVLLDVVNDLKKNQEKPIDKIVVLSNIKELILTWYRCYNWMADDFIYFIDGFETSLFRDQEYYGLIKSLADFSGINDEKVEGKVYINLSFSNYEIVLKQLVTDNNYKYFDNIENYDFGKRSGKLKVKKQYKYNDVMINFEHNTQSDEIIDVGIRNDKLDISEEFFNNLLNYNVYFFIVIVIALYKLRSEEMFDWFMNYFTVIGRANENIKARIKALIGKYLCEMSVSFVGKAHLMSFISALDGKRLRNNVWEI